MKYFYLSPDRKPQGPYSADELRALRTSGAIDDDTLAAAAGETSWHPYRELNLGEEGEAVPPPVGPRTLGNCPFCGQEIVATETPAECPHCGKTLHPGTGNLWLNFLSCMRRYVCFRGRAGRTEFWSFFLFYFIITYVVSNVWDLAVMSIYDIPADLKEQVVATDEVADVIAMMKPYWEGCLVSMAGEYLFPLLFVLPFYGVTVRRLHDRGHSAASVVLSLIGYGCLYGGIAALIALQLPILDHPEQAEAVIEQLFVQQGTAFRAVAAIGLGGILLGVTGIYMLVCCILPTKEGPNKYGPGL